MSDRPQSNNLFCVQPPSEKIFLATCRCFSVQFSLTFLKQNSWPWFEPCSLFQPSYSCLAAQFWYTDRGLCTSIFTTSFGQTKHVFFYLNTFDQRVPVRPFYAQITDLTSLLLQALSPVSTFGPPESDSSKLLFTRGSVFLSTLLLPSTEWPKSEALHPLLGRMLP